MALTQALIPDRRGASPLPIRIELPLPFPLRTVNAWLFPGAEPVLVDCGVNTPESYDALRAGIRNAGVNPEKLRLYITHGHVDHAGNAARLGRDFDIDLHAAPEEAPAVSTFRRDSGPRNDEYAQAMIDHGMPGPLAQKLRDASEEIDSLLEDCPISHEIHHESTIMLGNQEATAIRTPGHTDGSMCFWLTEDNQMLSGDTLLETITSNAGELRDADHGSFHKYVQTIESLRKFGGVECLPGHLKPFTLTDKVIDMHLDFHEQRRARIIKNLAVPRSAFELMAQIFPGKDSGPALFMGMAELVGHLHAAVQDGLVEQIETDGIRKFRSRA